MNKNRVFMGLEKMGRNRKRFLSIVCILIIISFSLFLQDSPSQPKKNFLWKVKSETNVVYLLGSIHYMKKEYYPLDEKIEKAFDQSDILVVEVNINDPTKIDIQKLIESATYQGNETLESHLSPEIYERVKGELIGLGIAPEMVMKYKAWFLALTLASLEMKKLGFDPNYGIDQYFLSKANGKKKILELEKLNDQIDLFATLSEKDQELLLLYILKDIKVLERELHRLTHAWFTGDEKAIESIIKRSSQEDHRLVPIYEKMIYERNRNMASKVENFLKEKETYFVIVGAGHLVGNQGIVEILKLKGFHLEQF
jgi:uncharacterized protein YbaP (TraB family)